MTTKTRHRAVTRRQVECAKTVAAFYATYDRGPTCHEVAQIMGISRSSAGALLSRATDSGLLQFGRGKIGGYRPTERGQNTDSRQMGLFLSGGEG